MNITLTENEVRVLKLILGVDWEALGLEVEDQEIAAEILKKIRGK